MAEITPPAVNGKATAGKVETSTEPATNGQSGKSTEGAFKRPEKPDEDKFKAALAIAEKEHATAQENLVRSHLLEF